MNSSQIGASLYQSAVGSSRWISKHHSIAIQISHITAPEALPENQLHSLTLCTMAQGNTPLPPNLQFGDSSPKRPLPGLIKNPKAFTASKVDSTLIQPNLYVDYLSIDWDTNPYKDLSLIHGELGGKWLWSPQYGYEVLGMGQLWTVDENLAVTSRPAQGQWMDPAWQTYVENGTQVLYKTVQGPVNFVNVDGVPLPPWHVRVDQHGRRTRLNDDNTWTNIDGLVQYLDNPDGTYTYIGPNVEGQVVVEMDSNLPLRLPSVDYSNPQLIWMGLRSIYGQSPPGPESVEGGVANPPLIPSNATDRSDVSSELRVGDPANPTWQDIDNWLEKAFPMSRYPAADSLDARLKHLEAFLPRLPPPQLTFAKSKDEASDVWVSVQTEIMIPCAWHDSWGAQKFFRSTGRKPFPVPSPFAPYTLVGASAGPPNEQITTHSLVEAIQDCMRDIADAQIRRRWSRPYFAFTWEHLSPEDQVRNHHSYFTDDQDRWYWNIEPRGFVTAPGCQVDSDTRLYKVAITSPAYRYNSPNWYSQPNDMFNGLNARFTWWSPYREPSLRVEVGPMKGTHWSTPQLRNIASFWYACEPYLQSLFPKLETTGGPFEPTHGRCRAAWGEPPARANWLCRLAENGARFSAAPMAVSFQCPESGQSEDALVRDGPLESGTYTEDKGRLVQRGSTVLHNGISPADSFWSRQPTDWEGNPTGRRENLWRLRRHEAISCIQQAASSPAVALMMSVNAHPHAPTQGYLDLGHYAAPTLGQEIKSNKRSLYITMAPSSLKGGNLGVWGGIVGGIIRLGACEDWPTLCKLMPPAFELTRSADKDVPDPATGLPRFPHGSETRYSEKFDVFDLLHKLGFDPKILWHIQSLMIHGSPSDGHIWGNMAWPLKGGR